MKEEKSINEIKSYGNGLQVFYRTIGLVMLIAFIIFSILIFLLKNF